MIQLSPLHDSNSLMDASLMRLAWRRHAGSPTPALLRRVGDELVTRLQDIRITPQRILDHSCCSPVTSQLGQFYPTAHVIQLGPEQHSMAARRDHDRPALVADHRLPFRSGQFDLIVANLMLHWSTDQRALLRSWHRLLRPDGLLLFSTLGSQSLSELRQAMATVDQHHDRPPRARLIELPTLNDLGQLMSHAGLRLVVLDRDSVTLPVVSIPELLQRLRRMGSVNPYRRAPHGGYPGRSFWSTVEQCYRQQQGLSATAELPVTFELIFGHGWH
ncbi:MAG: methyltransferase domain-containing protein [Magnetococcales bacterium]|nr:methyltransferase domain-containing protein [Magnetococcales bacterium]